MGALQRAEAWANLSTGRTSETENNLAPNSLKG